MTNVAMFGRYKKALWKFYLNEELTKGGGPRPKPLWFTGKTDEDYFAPCVETATRRLDAAIDEARKSKNRAFGNTDESICARILQGLNKEAGFK